MAVSVPPHVRAGDGNRKPRPRGDATIAILDSQKTIRKI